MSDETLSIEVPTLLAGVRIDRGIAMVANVSRAMATELIAGGRVMIDDIVVEEGKGVLREGSRLTIALAESGGQDVAPEAGVSFGVVHADAHVVVVDKPAGLVVHPGAGHHDGTLVGGLLARYPDLGKLVSAGVCPPDRPGIVHRLDKGTSGLLAVARTEEAYQNLVGQLADRSMERRYLALVEGTVIDDRGEIDAPIGRSTRTPTKMAIAAGGRSARTGYTVLERRSEPRPTTLLELKLESGRTHQIRVHMAAIGHPVVGDARYGTPDRRLGSGRFFLHAFRLAFTHPDSAERVEFVAALPADLEGY
ncbi:MAG TPA: RluA family pseudouridine synthase [Acidimicrobiales bacterium]|jgi:23S rRNA pseudouridine1911/1915/1917 synthase